MGSLRNHVQLIGNIRKKKIIRDQRNVRISISILLITNDYFVDSFGVKQSNIQQHIVSVKGKNANVIEHYLNEGQEILIIGRLVNNTHKDKRGVEFITTVIECTGMVVLNDIATLKSTSETRLRKNDQRLVATA